MRHRGDLPGPAEGTGRRVSSEARRPDIADIGWISRDSSSIRRLEDAGIGPTGNPVRRTGQSRFRLRLTSRILNIIFYNKFSGLRYAKKGWVGFLSMEKRKILESWKEISDYLHRSIKTCQRWEIELHLPVHRLEETSKARVFAFPDELDRWMIEKLDEKNPVPAEDLQDPHPRPDGPGPVPSPESEERRACRGFRWRSIRRILPVIAGFIGLAALILFHLLSR
jgi:hypothetical protein